MADLVSLVIKSSLTSRNIAKRIAAFASDKKAEDIKLLDMRSVVNFCDYFVICTGNTDRQVRAIADAVDDGLFGLGIKVHFKQGMDQYLWVILDLGDVVTHIFEKRTREFYKLDYLWRDAKQVSWNNTASQ